ncbi:MAG: recombination protein RecR [Desulfotalea sp.]|nr:MAG: recombination protein RecR [Desulfotalea sp.]
MQVIPPALEKLIEQLSRLPGIGKKTATRLALTILRKPRGLAQDLGAALLDLHSSIQLCSCCFTFSDSDPCAICGDPKREGKTICVVEQSGDLMAIEKTGIFRGHYHVLHGVLSPLDGIGPEEIKVRELLARIKSGTISEVIIATSSTVPGEATATLLADVIKNENVLLTRLACGIPMGMDIKYADKYTLARAIEARSDVN